MLNRRDAMKGVAAGIAAVGVCPAVSAGHLSYASLHNMKYARYIFILERKTALICVFRAWGLLNEFDGDSYLEDWRRVNRDLMAIRLPVR